jgi:hypothetical protein
VAVAVQGERDRGVPGPDANPLGVRAGRDPQRDGGVPQVVARGRGNDAAAGPGLWAAP